MRGVSGGRAILMASILLFAGSCKRASEPPQARVKDSALEDCIAKAGYKGDPNASPTVMAAARACAEEHIRKPTVQLWAQQAGTSLAPDIVQESDRVFIEALLDCAKQKGLKIAIERTDGGSFRIEARSARSGAVIGSSDPDFMACTSSAEAAERERLRPLL